MRPIFSGRPFSSEHQITELTTGETNSGIREPQMPHAPRRMGNFRTTIASVLLATGLHAVPAPTKADAAMAHGEHAPSAAASFNGTLYDQYSAAGMLPEPNQEFYNQLTAGAADCGQSTIVSAARIYATLAETLPKGVSSREIADTTQGIINDLADSRVAAGLVALPDNFTTLWDDANSKTPVIPTSEYRQTAATYLTAVGIQLTLDWTQVADDQGTELTAFLNDLATPITPDQAESPQVKKMLAGIMLAASVLPKPMFHGPSDESAEQTPSLMAVVANFEGAYMHFSGLTVGNVIMFNGRMQNSRPIDLATAFIHENDHAATDRDNGDRYRCLFAAMTLLNPDNLPYGAATMTALSQEGVLNGYGTAFTNNRYTLNHAAAGAQPYSLKDPREDPATCAELLFPSPPGDTQSRSKKIGTDLLFASLTHNDIIYKKLAVTLASYKLPTESLQYLTAYLRAAKWQSLIRAYATRHAKTNKAKQSLRRLVNKLDGALAFPLPANMTGLS